MPNAIRTGEDAWVGGRSIPEVALWRGVIEMALRDASGKTLPGATCPGTQKAVRNHARQWFFAAPWGFKQVCTLALLDWQAVQQAAIRKIREADNARADKGA